MRYLVWLIRIVVLLVLLVLALNNTDDVTLNLVLGHKWTAPLILISFAFFVVGLLAGLASAVPTLFRHRMENGRLKRELKTARNPVEVPPDQPPIM